MMKDNCKMIDGIRIIRKEGFILYYIDSFSETIQSEIRKHLSEICYGAINSSSEINIYSYKATAKEFITRYKSPTSDDKRKKGLIGELLFHILMAIESNYLPASAFFNTEERSLKKGFDVTFYDSDNQELWFAEVKSGEKQKNQGNQSTAITHLISVAKNDMKKRLNQENNVLWQNAINHAIITVKETKDEKKVIMNLLGNFANDASVGKYTSSDKNVILVGVLFHTLTQEVDAQKIQAKCDQLIKENYFNTLIVIAIQKNTYEAVFHFLEREANDGE